MQLYFLEGKIIYSFEMWDVFVFSKSNLLLYMVLQNQWIVIQGKTLLRF